MAFSVQHPSRRRHCRHRSLSLSLLLCLRWLLLLLLLHFQPLQCRRCLVSSVPTALTACPPSRLSTRRPRRAPPSLTLLFQHRGYRYNARVRATHRCSHQGRARTQHPSVSPRHHPPRCTRLRSSSPARAVLNCVASAPSSPRQHPPPAPRRRCPHPACVTYHAPRPRHTHRTVRYRALFTLRVTMCAHCAKGSLTRDSAPAQAILGCGLSPLFVPFSPSFLSLSLCPFISSLCPFFRCPFVAYLGLLGLLRLGLLGLLRLGLLTQTRRKAHVGCNQ